MRKLNISLWSVLTLIALAFTQGAGALAQTPIQTQLQAGSNAPVKIILWFDTEDYLLPASDDAAKRLATLLTQRGIRATFKVVGEKARVLESRNRKDVIDALKQHDIGYHANFHSVHPTPSEYLAECGWLDGVSQFASREGGGALDVMRVFNRKTLSCYGQPGSSWASQAIGALRQIGVAPSGIPCYVDEGNHVGLDQKPFWYAGALNVYHMGENYTRMDLHDPAAVAPGKEKVKAIADRLRSQGGGLISIFYHPCEWVHQEFWDGVNFRRGANPPRTEWKAPAQRPPEQTEAAFARFAEYVDFIRAQPGVQFVTASDLPALYPDRTRTEDASIEDQKQIASQLEKAGEIGINFIVGGGKAYSPADQFDVMATAVARKIRPRASKLRSLLGPDGPPPAAIAPMHVSWPAFLAAVEDVNTILIHERRVPARVMIGADAVAPADFLAALGPVYKRVALYGRFPEKEGVDIPAKTRLLTEDHIAMDTPGLFGGWVIHKEGFRAPKIMEVARWQAWTLKPAIPARSPQ